MKKEYLFFLVMLLAAAVITGATIGFISNFHYIEKQVQENLNQLKPANSKFQSRTQIMKVIRLRTKLLVLKTKRMRLLILILRQKKLP